MRIGVACPIPGERAAFLEWLECRRLRTGADARSGRRWQAILAVRPIEALIADVGAWCPPGAAARRADPGRRTVRCSSSARPGTAPEVVPRDATLDRAAGHPGHVPVARGARVRRRPAGPAVAAEVRPEPVVDDRRRGGEGHGCQRRRRTPRGVRGADRALPPYFTLRVPGFGLSIKVKRVWVAAPPQGSMWCGGVVDKPLLKTKTAWDIVHRSGAKHGGDRSQPADVPVRRA